jgi:hypothetical protein
LGIIGFASAAGEIVQPLKIDTPSPIPTYIPCPAPNECLSQYEADTRWGAGGYVQGVSGMCGVVSANTEFKIPRFCYRMIQPIAGVTTTPVPGAARLQNPPPQVILAKQVNPAQIPAHLPGQVVPAYFS